MTGAARGIGRVPGELLCDVDAVGGGAIEPAGRETYDSGVAKVTYQDADGNEISLGGSPG